MLIYKYNDDDTPKIMKMIVALFDNAPKFTKKKEFLLEKVLASKSTYLSMNAVVILQHDESEKKIVTI